MIEKGCARSIYKYLMENHKETLDKLGLELKIAESPMEEFAIDKYPPSFMKFMGDQGYCNRERFNTYAACDVLSYVIIAENRLFKNQRLNHEVNSYLGLTIKLKERYGIQITCINFAKELYREIYDNIFKQPIIVDFQGVREISNEFLAESIGRIYLEVDKSIAIKNLMLIDFNSHAIYEQIMEVKDTALKMKNPKYKSIIERLIK